MWVNAIYLLVCLLLLLLGQPPMASFHSSTSTSTPTPSGRGGRGRGRNHDDVNYCSSSSDDDAGSEEVVPTLIMLGDEEMALAVRFLEAYEKSVAATNARDEELYSALQSVMSTFVGSISSSTTTATAKQEEEDQQQIGGDDKKNIGIL